MNVKHTISTLAATLIIAGAGSAAADQGKNKRQERQDRREAAQNREQPAAASFGLGVAETNRRGATAGALIGSGTQGRNGGNTATTFGTGAITTDRNSANAAVSTGGTASGQGVQSTSSEVDAYGGTNRQGSNADVYGNSTASSGQRPAPAPRRPQ